VAQSGGAVLLGFESGRGAAGQLCRRGRVDGRHLGLILADRNLKPQRYEWRAEGRAILEQIRVRGRRWRAKNNSEDSLATLH
jgi:hypothetical protein